MSQKFDRVFINTMDRCVWFILLAVMSHLVTEFSGVSGFARGQPENDLLDLNDTAPIDPADDKINFTDGLPSEIPDETENSTTPKHSTTAATTAKPTKAPRTFGISPLFDTVLAIPVNTLNAINKFITNLADNVRSSTRSVVSSVKKCRDR